MGTRADFYVGRGEKAEWIGSIAWDGYPEPYIDDGLFADATDVAWRERVAAFLKTRDDATNVADGWPWPWDDSNTTDWAYTLDDGKVYCSCFGRAWIPIAEYVRKSKETEKLLEADSDEADEDWWEKIGPKPTHPNMTSVQKVTLGARSGVLVFSATK